VITFWEDSTEKKEMEKENQRAELVSKFVSPHFTICGPPLTKCVQLENRIF
jgi:hypothetical protein